MPRATRRPSVIECVRSAGGRVVLELDCFHTVTLRALSPLVALGGGWPCPRCPPLAPLLPVAVTGYHARLTVPRRGVVVVLRPANESETSPVLSASPARAVGSR